MLDNWKSLNKRTTDWQQSQIKLLGKATTANLATSLTVLEATADFVASAQQDWFDAFKPAAR